MSQVFVVVVIGVSCGVGCGIVFVFGLYGCIVYVIGCLFKEGDVSVFGMVVVIVEEVIKVGGKGIVVKVDYVNDVEVKVLFE